MFDLTAAFSEAYQWSQQGSGGFNHDNNCLPTATNACLMAIGFGGTSPQQITNTEYGPYYHGGEDYSKMIDYVSRFVDGSLAVTVQGGDMPSVIELFGNMGWPMVFTGECDAWGNYVTGYTGYQHCSAVLRREGNFTVLLNSETFHEVGYYDNDLRTINRSNALLLFRRPVKTWGKPSVDTTEDLLLMADIGLSADDRQRAYCRQRWHFYVHRAIPDDKTMDDMLSMLRNRGADPLETALSDSPEGAKDEAEIRKLLDSQAV